MLRVIESVEEGTVEGVASEILGTLYRGVVGEAPLALRAYRDDDAVMLLLRFDPALLENRGAAPIEPLIEISFLAMPELVADAVRERTGRTLIPGNLSVCADRGLAVFAFSVFDEDRVDPRYTYSLDSGLRIAS